MTGNQNVNMILDCCKQGNVWKNVKINDKTHMIYFTKENDLWKVLLTNLIEIWIETLTDETIFHKCQTLNPLLNLEAFDWKQVVMDMLNDIPKYIFSYNVDTVGVSACQIELRKDKDYVKLKFSLNLSKGTPQEFWENVTMPLCLSSMELIRRHDILLDLIKRKDEEIVEYKAEGAELIRKYIATKPFSEELFHNDNAAPIATDFVNTFQYVLHFYNAMNLPTSYMKMESEISSNRASDNNASKIDENILPDSTKIESIQKLRQDKSDRNEQMHSKIQECEYEAGSSTKEIPVLKINSTSHIIQRSFLKKNKKALSDFIL